MGNDVGNGSGQGVAVAQAQGMVSVQVDCTVEEALVLLSARARSSAETLEQVAIGVIEGRVRFDE